jgi:hypothetical protein
MEARFWQELTNGDTERKKLESFKNEFEQIKETLRGELLLSFLQLNAPELLPA